jgi:hypothetical protein
VIFLKIMPSSCPFLVRLFLKALRILRKYFWRGYKTILIIDFEAIIFCKTFNGVTFKKSLLLTFLSLLFKIIIIHLSLYYTIILLYILILIISLCTFSYFFNFLYSIYCFFYFGSPIFKVVICKILKYFRELKKISKLKYYWLWFKILFHIFLFNVWAIAYSSGVYCILVFICIEIKNYTIRHAIPGNYEIEDLISP